MDRPSAAQQHTNPLHGWGSTIRQTKDVARRRRGQHADGTCLRSPGVGPLLHDESPSCPPSRAWPSLSRAEAALADTARICGQTDNPISPVRRTPASFRAEYGGVRVRGPASRGEPGRRLFGASPVLWLRNRPGSLVTPGAKARCQSGASAASGPPRLGVTSAGQVPTMVRGAAPCSEQSCWWPAPPR